MNRTRNAFISATWLIIGFAALCSPSFAATAPGKKPAASQPKAQPEMCDHERKGGMMGDQMDGMMDGMMGGLGGGMMMGSPRLHEVMSLDLNDEQRSRINKLSDDLKHDNWATRGLIMDESAKLRDLYEADTRDPAAIGKEYQKIFDLQRQMIEATITTQNRIEELLTPEQRAQLKKQHHGKMPMHDHPMR